MDFTLSKEHEMARSLFREFAEKEVKPLAIEVDETEEFPVETVKKMAKADPEGVRRTGLRRFDLRNVRGGACKSLRHDLHYRIRTHLPVL